MVKHARLRDAAGKRSQTKLQEAVLTLSQPVDPPKTASAQHSDAETRSNACTTRGITSQADDFRSFAVAENGVQSNPIHVGTARFSHKTHR